MVGWIKMPLGTEVGLGSGDRQHCVRWGPSSPQAPMERGTAVLSPLFGLYLLWSDHWMDQDTTWY